MRGYHVIDGIVVYPGLYEIGTVARISVRINGNGINKILKDPDGFICGFIRLRAEIGQKLELKYDGSILFIEGYACRSERVIDFWTEARDYLCLIDLCTNLTFLLAPSQRFRSHRIAA